MPNEALGYALKDDNIFCTLHLDTRQLNGVFRALQHGNAALHLAAERGHEKVANLLLLNKAFVNAKSKVGVTPLHVAAQNGFNGLVKLLIEKHGATIDALSLVSSVG